MIFFLLLVHPEVPGGASEELILERWWLWSYWFSLILLPRVKILSLQTT